MTIKSEFRVRIKTARLLEWIESNITDITLNTSIEIVKKEIDEWGKAHIGDDE